MISRIRLTLVAMVWTGGLCVSAQQVPYDPLGPEIGQDKIELKKIPAPPVAEGVAAQKTTERPAREKVPTKAAYSDNDGSNTLQVVPIPPKPVDERSGMALAPKRPPVQEAQKSTGDMDDEGKGIPLVKIPAAPVNEKH